MKKGKCVFGFLGGLIIGLLINTFVLNVYVVSGVSMEPTLKDGDNVYICKVLKPHVNDIVVAEVNGKLIIKRMVSEYNNSDTTSYYLLGDNKENSWDSRYFGAVPEKDVIGVVIGVCKNT